MLPENDPFMLKARDIYFNPEVFGYDWHSYGERFESREIGMLALKAITHKRVNLLYNLPNETRIRNLTILANNLQNFDVPIRESDLTVPQYIPTKMSELLMGEVGDVIVTCIEFNIPLAVVVLNENQFGKAAELVSHKGAKLGVIIGLLKLCIDDILQRNGEI